jgi:hypothetical protein
MMVHTQLHSSILYYCFLVVDITTDASTVEVMIQKTLQVLSIIYSKYKQYHYIDASWSLDSQNTEEMYVNLFFNCLACVPYLFYFTIWNITSVKGLILNNNSFNVKTRVREVRFKKNQMFTLLFLKSNFS